MAVLESCPKHNMVAYLEKTDGNAEFHEIIDFLTRSSIHYALTVSPVISTTFVEQFWTSAKSQTINNVRYINAKVAGKPVTISEASIRSDLHFNDVDGIDSLNNQAIFDAIKLMGYEGDLTVLTFNKALFSPQWKFLFHTLNHCLSSKSTSWDQIPTNIATAGKHFSRKVTPLFPNMLVHPTEDEGEGSARPSEPQPTPSPPHPNEAYVEPQSDPSPGPSPTNTILYHSEVLVENLEVIAQPVEIKSLKEQVKKLKKQARPFILHHKDWLGTVKRKNQNKKKVLKTSKRRSVFKQRRKTVKSSKGAPTVPINTEWDDLQKRIEKDKGIYTESKKVSEDKKKFDQIAHDEEVARKIQEEWEAEEERKRLTEEEATKTALSNEYDFIQARIEADRLLAERVQEAEREQFTVEESKISSC
ncbi:hypothetical protein Tco_0453159 [Tanacetum coccineum]